MGMARASVLQQLLLACLGTALLEHGGLEEETCSMLQTHGKEKLTGTCPSDPTALSVADLKGQDFKVSDGETCWHIQPGVSISQAQSGSTSDCSSADYIYVIGNYVDSSGNHQNYEDGSSTGCPGGKARSASLVVYSIAEPPIKETSLSVSENPTCTYQLTLILAAQGESAPVSILSLDHSKEQHRQAPSCSSYAGDARPASQSQLSRKCFPVFQDDQDIFMYFMNYRMAAGSIHEGIGWRSSCIKSMTMTAGSSSNPAMRVQEYPDGVKTSNSDACGDVCKGSKDCQAFVFDQSSACSKNCFPLAEATGSAEKSGFTYGLVVRYDPCSEVKGTIGFGAYQFGADGTLSPSSVDTETGSVIWNDKALEVSLQTDQNGFASYWTDAAGIGKLKGSLLNTFFDWVSVPSDNRDDLSPIADGDTNYVALATQYNFYGAIQSSSLYSGQQDYLPATSCGDFVFACFRYFSEYHNVNFQIVQDQQGCFGNGCSELTSLTHQQLNFVSASVPTLIGDAATPDCAAFWEWFDKSLVLLMNGADWDKVKDAIISGISGYYGVYSKACIYKNKKWYATPMSINIFNALSWSSMNTFKCEKGWFSCKGDKECSLGGACLQGDAFWTPAVGADVKTALLQQPCNTTEDPLSKEDIEKLAQEITDKGKAIVANDPRFYGHWNYISGVILPSKHGGSSLIPHQTFPQVVTPW